MIYRKLGNSDLHISAITLGTIGIGDGKNDAASISAIHAAADAGINLIDLAPCYGAGHAEEVVGKALKEISHDKFFIATKCGEGVGNGKWWKSSKPEAIRKQLEESLKRVGVDCFDLYQIHWPDPNTPFEETFAELESMKREGKIKNIGVSNFNIDQLEEARQYCNIVSLQPPYSLLERRIEKDILPYCATNGIGVISYGSIGGGALTGKFKELPVFKEGDIRGSGFYTFFLKENWPHTLKVVDIVRKVAKTRGVSMVEVAINWVLATEGMTSAIVGARNAEQVSSNAKAVEWEMTEEEYALIKNESDNM